MNILIYFANQLNPQRGGTERVACLLADYFLSKGHNVAYMAFRSVNQQNSRESVFLPDKNESTSQRNIKFVLDYININKIDVIINEGASTDSIYLFSHKYIPSHVKIISHVHFDITGDLDHLWRTQYMPFIGVPPIVTLKNILKWIKYPFNKYRGLHWKRKHFDFIYHNTDTIVVLSKKQRLKLMSLLRLTDDNKIYGLVNPNTIDTHECDFAQKLNVILYVGRLDYGQKRVDRVLRVWEQIYSKLPDWNLVIAGFGPFKEYYEKIAVKLKLPRVDFVGQIDASEYYKKSKILVMTSNFEGTPMVIPECMSYGVVPVVMNTFDDASLYIKNKQNGFLTKPFNVRSMANTLLRLADGKELIGLGYAAKQTIDNIDNDAILLEWDKLLCSLSM